MTALEWLDLAIVEERIREALKIPQNRRIRIKHANFAKIKNQKFFVRYQGHDLLATFYVDHVTARKEALILDYLNNIKSEALNIGFVAPKKLYHRNGLLIRESISGELMAPRKTTDQTLQQLARLLLLFKKTSAGAAFKEYSLSYARMRDWARRQIPQAKEAFTPFRGSGEAFDRLVKILGRDWSKSLRLQDKNYVHGDLQPQNILLPNSKIALIDFDRGGYFYPLFDAASFAVQFTHVALLGQYHQGKIDRRQIRRQREVFMKEYRRGLRELGASFDEQLFRLFKLLIIFNGLAFSTAGFRKKVTRGHKHLLFGLLRQELKRLI